MKEVVSSNRKRSEILASASQTNQFGRNSARAYKKVAQSDMHSAQREINTSVCDQ